MKIHEKIKFFRRQNNWTQEQLAHKLNMSPNGYGDIERGDTDITWTRLEQIAQVFGMNVLELIGMNEKSVFRIQNMHNSGHHWNLLTSTENQTQSTFENEKLQLTNLQLEREILYLRQEIEYQKKIISLLENYNKIIPDVESEEV